MDKNNIYCMFHQALSPDDQWYVEFWGVTDITGFLNEEGVLADDEFGCYKAIKVKFPQHMLAGYTVNAIGKYSKRDQRLGLFFVPAYAKAAEVFKNILPNDSYIEPQLETVR